MLKTPGIIVMSVLICIMVSIMVSFQPSYRQWSLITGRGATKQEGGGGNFYPYQKGGRKSLSHAEGGPQKVLR